MNHRIFERILRCGSQCLSMPGRVSFPTLTSLNNEHVHTLYVCCVFFLTLWIVLSIVGWESVLRRAATLCGVVSWHRLLKSTFFFGVCLYMTHIATNSRCVVLPMWYTPHVWFKNSALHGVYWGYLYCVCHYTFWDRAVPRRVVSTILTLSSRRVIFFIISSLLLRTDLGSGKITRWI